LGYFRYYELLTKTDLQTIELNFGIKGYEINGNSIKSGDKFGFGKRKGTEFPVF